MSQICLSRDVELFLCSLSGPPLMSVMQAERCAWLVRWLQQGQSGCGWSDITVFGQNTFFIQWKSLSARPAACLNYCAVKVATPFHDHITGNPSGLGIHWLVLMPEGG
jgi:hypothetical protein